MKPQKAMPWSKSTFTGALLCNLFSNQRRVGRVSPLRAAVDQSKPGAHGVTRPTLALIALLFTFLLPLTARADVAPGTLMWFQSSLSAGAGTAEARAVTVDLDDNTIVVGRFLGTVNFFGTNLTATSASIPSGFVAKFNASGAVLWCKKLATVNFTELVAVTTDPAGNIYIGGTASGNFTNGPVTLTIAAGNGQDALLLKLDAAGNAVWGKALGGTGTDTLVALQYAKDGTLVICGSFLGSITLGATSYTTRGSSDAYVARMATDGTVINSWRIGATSNDSAISVSVDSDGNIVVVGQFTTNTDLGNGQIAGPGLNNIFLAKYNPNGSLLWYRFNTATVITVSSVNAARSNVVWLTGSFSGSGSFGDSSPLTTANGRSWFAVKLDSSGNFILNKKWGDGSGANDLPRGSVVGDSGRLSLTGQIKSNPSDWGSYGSTLGNGLIDTAFATTDDAGMVLWAKQVLATNNGTGYAVALTANEDQIFAGLTGAGDYGAGTIIIGAGGREAFVARYRGFGPEASSVPTNYAAWAERHFSVQMIDDPAFGGPNGDLDGDGVANYWEFLFNQSPWLVDNTNQVTWSYVSNRIGFTFPRSKLATNAPLWMEVSTNLLTGWFSNAPITSIAPLDANFDQVTLTDTVASTDVPVARFLWPGNFGVKYPVVTPLDTFVYVSPLGSDANSGTSVAPVATIATALLRATAGSARTNVLVARGTYPLASLTLIPGITIYGGYHEATWERSAANHTILTVPSSGLLVNNLTNTAILDQLEITGANATGAGASAYGLFVMNSPGLVLRNCTITSGAGVAGVSGSAGSTPGTAGGNGVAGTGGCEQGGAFCSTCAQPQGGAGGSSPVGNTGGKGGNAGIDGNNGAAGSAGTGGAAGGPGTPARQGDWNTPSTYWGTTGVAGSTGAAGTAGSTSGYAFASSGFSLTSAATGGGGATGGNGLGGGGGGGGGGGDNNCNSYGGAGGGGGGGGSSGTGGTGATGGGGSFAVYLWNSSVVIDNCVLQSSAGGAGGAGGSGAAGGAGGIGGSPDGTGRGNPYTGASAQDDGSNGGRGGAGGAGGTGGQGGGGVGGPSVCVYRGGTSTPVVTSGSQTPAAVASGGSPNGAAGVSAGVYP